MKERPILFSATMVRAILEGRKTQTRRVMKTQYVNVAKLDPYTEEMLLRHCPYGQIGDRLWVRETWTNLSYEPSPDKACVLYRADGEEKPYELNWRPSIFMPRWASRITLEIIDARVHRLQEISEEDAACEGVEKTSAMIWRNYFEDCAQYSAKSSFASLWQSINGKNKPGGEWDAWDANPWVWALTFKRVA